MNIDAIIEQMTLEEKCACITGDGYWVLGGCPRLNVDPIAVSDGPHGLRKQSGASDNLGLAESDPAICYPTASASACTFNVDLVREMGEALGDEAREQEVAILLGPGVNMKRSPLCGRNFEYLSEDPYLAGMLGAACIQGVQSRGVGTSLKHFACNNQETNRLIVDSLVDERALHELYLEPFRISVEQGKPWTIMTAYNLLNGTYCSENPWLMTELARETWDFNGTFVTDWGAESSNEASLPAGLDLVMPGMRRDYRQDVARAVEEGRISEDQLNLALRRILHLHELHEQSQDRGIIRDEKARLKVARAVAEESAVLLKNNGVLPFSSDESLAVIGAFAKQPRYQGAGSSKINPITLDCTFDALENAGVSCTFAPGYDVITGETTDALIDEAIRVAQAAKCVVVFAGLPDASESEGSDRVNMDLPAGHNRLIESICSCSDHVVVVLQGGSPVELPWRDKPQALLLAYLSGCQGGQALADLLLGKANPSGKLAETWPLSLASTPCADFYPEQGRQAFYRESIFNGYRYYDAIEGEVAYPFGFGLSYTTFSYSNLVVKPSSTNSDVFEVSCTIKNQGNCFGKETVQLYLAPIDPGVFKAPQQLKGFVKVALEPGEEQLVSFTVERRAFAHFDTVAHAWVVEAGAYEVRVGSSSRAIHLKALLDVEGVAKKADNAPGAYHRVSPGAFTIDVFKLLYGQEFPKVIVAMRPYTANATIGDLRASLVGRFVHYLLRRELKLLVEGGKVKRLDAELAIMSTPLRSLAMSGMDMNLVKAVVDILNYHFIRGFKLLASLKPDSEESSATQKNAR